jgi:predicted DNA-binding transcriptional regulator AlpA
MAKRMNSETDLATIRAGLVPASLRDDRVINKQAAAAMVGLHPRVLDRRIAAGEGPPFLWIGKRKKGFVVREVRCWLRSLA